MQCSSALAAPVDKPTTPSAQKQRNATEAAQLAANFVDLIALLLAGSVEPEADSEAADSEDANVPNGTTAAANNGETTGSANQVMLALSAGSRGQKTDSEPTPAPRSKHRHNSDQNGITNLAAPVATLVPAACSDASAPRCGQQQNPAGPTPAAAGQPGAAPASMAGAAIAERQSALAFVLDLKSKGQPADPAAKAETNSSRANSVEQPQTGAPQLHPGAGVAAASMAKDAQHGDAESHGREWRDDKALGEYQALHKGELNSSSLEQAAGSGGSTAIHSTAHARVDAAKVENQQPAQAADATRNIAPADAPEPAKSTHVHEITLEGSDAVKVRVVERGGGIQVSVRSSDADLTHSLRRDLGDLVTKLEDKGFEAKAWRPQDPAPAIAAHGLDARETQMRTEANAGSNSNPDPEQRGGRNGSGQQHQQQQRHGDVRRWFEELDETARRDSSHDLEGIWR